MSDASAYKKALNCLKVSHCFQTFISNQLDILIPDPALFFIVTFFLLLSYYVFHFGFHVFVGIQKYIFCILCLYPVTLLNSFIISRCFLVDSLGFFTQITICRQRQFSSVCLIYMPFVSFSCLITLVKTSSIMLDKSGENRYPYLVPEFRGKTFTLLPISMMSALGFVDFP